MRQRERRRQPRKMHQIRDRVKCDKKPMVTKLFVNSWYIENGGRLWQILKSRICTA